MTSLILFLNTPSSFSPGYAMAMMLGLISGTHGSRILHTCIPAISHMHKHTTHTQTFTYVYTHTLAHTHPHTHMYTLTRTHTHTHLLIVLQKQRFLDYLPAIMLHIKQSNTYKLLHAAYSQLLPETIVCTCANGVSILAVLYW